ncbi:DUF2147 domain-containing protein [Novimethylophilus kurashikiensis]|nr:DUF2147 domain-containing protein [Novimethylophilus kurashikiensis]
MLLASMGAQADITGLWQEYDDDTGKVDALIRISRKADNTYEGAIEKVVEQPGIPSETECSHCTGELHNHPMLGLRILWGMKRHDKLHYEDGEILDPDDGKIYHCSIRLSEDGKTLQVTGFINFSWIGQSEIWRRSE